MFQLEQVSSSLPASDLGAVDSREVAQPTLPRRVVTTMVAWLEMHALFVAAVAAVAILSLALVPAHLNQDGWLALVAGRYIAGHGIPHHDTLAVMTHGTRWVDQQWLAQLGIYGLYQLGGLALYSIVYVVMSIAGLAMTVAASRALGGTERHILWVLPVAGFLYFVASFQIRTQGFAYPLFAATLWLLASEVRSRSRKRVYLVFPLLILWANLHGSVTIGVALALTYGLTLLVEDVRRGWRRRAWPRVQARAVLFLLTPVLCLFITPYGGAIIGYYRETLFNPAFSHLVTEWQPVTSDVVLATPFFALAAATIWLLGRSGTRTALFNHLALIVLAGAAVTALRSIAWFALAVIVLLPASIDSVLTSRAAPSRRPAANLLLVGLSLVVLIGTTIAIAVKPAAWFQRSYDLRAARTVAAVLRQHPQAKIYASDHLGDWLLWEEPQLSGHIAYDIRFELLTNRQLNAIAAVPNQRRLLAPYGVLVLDSAKDPAKRLIRRGVGIHVILRGKRVVVATTPAI